MFLYEIPHCENYGRKPERKLYQEFLSQFPEKKYHCEIPKYNDKAESCTIAIWNKNDSMWKTWIRQYNFRRENPDFKEALIKAGKSQANRRR